jgi:hypothetical protein
MRENPTLEVLYVPKVCETCLMDALTFALKREGFNGVQLQSVSFKISRDMVEKNIANETNFETSDIASPNFVKFGLVGNPLLVFEEFLNDSIAELLHELDVDVIWPDPLLLDVEDVRYLEQLRKFYDEGIRDIIYLQSFSCLKGHVMARGALHYLADTFPGMTITVIDYDPESSALNRENRIRLAVSQAKDCTL